jgi:hypothetical protein
LALPTRQTRPGPLSLSPTPALCVAWPPLSLPPEVLNLFGASARHSMRRDVGEAAPEPTTWKGAVALFEHVGRHDFLNPDRRPGTPAYAMFLSECNECGGELSRLGQEFPHRLVAAIRGIVERLCP